ncbi:MAG: type II toxin-antitoxin system Phd/YefM family antitoxin [Candidatus Riflebacteria bacterium]|nr:type II toxin-antitoxin system Phd/YefM family antitoxin [Candidatus Riflebacteria bacterium]
MKRVNIYEAKTRLSELVERAAAGEDVVIARAGTPVARLTHLRRPGRKRRLGLPDGRFQIPDDFNEPLPDEIVRGFENG